MNCAFQPANGLRVVLGSMMMGGSCDEAQSARVLDTYVSAFKSYRSAGGSPPTIDTARIYCNGATEHTVAALLHNAGGGSVGPMPAVAVDTKAHPSYTRGQPWSPSAPCRGGFTPEKIRQQLDDSLAALKQHSVDVFYLHSPDHEVPLDDTLAALNQLHEEKRFKEFGLSNYSAWQVADICHRCEVMGFVRPTVYQGMYNVLTRAVEAELIPCCRSFGLRFYAYNPMAAGMLVQSRFEAIAEAGREAGRPTTGRMASLWYQDRFYTDGFLEGASIVHAACNSNQKNSSLLRLEDVAMRWLVFHSMLDPSKGDAIIVGGSKLEQVESNLRLLGFGEATEAAAPFGPLGSDLLEATERGWKVVRGSCPSYFR